MSWGCCLNQLPLKVWQYIWKDKIANLCLGLKTKQNKQDLIENTKFNQCYESSHRRRKLTGQKENTATINGNWKKKSHNIWLVFFLSHESLIEEINIVHLYVNERNLSWSQGSISIHMLIYNSCVYFLSLFTLSFIHCTQYFISSSDKRNQNRQ